MGYRLGIDLGTTFTAAAVLRDGRPEVFPLGDHGLEVPSVVLLRPDGTFVVGDAAERQGLTAPHRLAREFKRRTGDGTSLRLAGTPYSAHSLTATLLRWVVQRVEQRESAPPDEIVVTHPANWGPFKRELLLHATSLADLEDVLLCTEPEAAAMHYASLQRLHVGDVVAVYDLGGGTFDSAVLARTPGGFELLGSPVGIEQLGGVDFDDALFHHVLAALGDAVKDIDPADETAMTGVARLRRDCVLAKEALSEDPEFSVPVNLPGLHTQVRLTRGEFEDLIRPPVVDTVTALRRALRGAQVEPADVSAVLLAGGSSRIPLVAATISAELGRPVSVDAHPKHLVALGAARYGAPATPRPPGPVAPPPPAPTDEDSAVLEARPVPAGAAAVPTGAVPTRVTATDDRTTTGGASTLTPPTTSGPGASDVAAPPRSLRSPPPAPRLRSSLTRHVRSSAHAAGSAVHTSSRRVVAVATTSAHGVRHLLLGARQQMRKGTRGVPLILHSTLRRLRMVRPSLPVAGAVAAVLVTTAVVVVLVPRLGSDDDPDPAASACPAAPGVGDDSVFAIPPPPGRGDQFHVQGGKIHTWLHEAAGRLDVVTTEADEACYPYGDGRWGVADANGDGRSDLLHVMARGVNSWVAQGGGAYDLVAAGKGTAREDNVSGLWGAADVDGDGDADLVHVTAEGVSTWIGDGRGDFAVGRPQAGPQPAALEQGQWRVADVDGGGAADLVHITQAGIETWFSRPGGSYDVKLAPDPPNTSPGTYPYTVGTWFTGDVTADGRADLVQVIPGHIEPGDTTSPGKGAVVTWDSRGDGSYAANAESQRADTPFRYYPYDEGEWFLANVNADPAAEVLHVNGTDITVWRSPAQGRYERRASSLERATPDTETLAWRIGDLQGDGRADLVQVWDGGVDTWLAGPDGTFSHAGRTADADYLFDHGMWLSTAGST